MKYTEETKLIIKKVIQIKIDYGKTGLHDTGNPSVESRAIVSTKSFCNTNTQNYVHNVVTVMNYSTV
jgi:hypothetical protein